MPVAVFEFLKQDYLWNSSFNQLSLQNCGSYGDVPVRDPFKKIRCTAAQLHRLCFQLVALSGFIFTELRLYSTLLRWPQSMIYQDDGWQNWTIFVQYRTSLMDSFALELPVGLARILSDLYMALWIRFQSPASHSFLFTDVTNQ